MDELIKNARSYWALGLPIVPLKDKQPLIEWAKWQMQTQTEEEFNGLPWSHADGFAIVCGSKTKEGYYIGAIDFDVKNLPSEAVEKGRQALKGLPLTQIEQTPSRGLHYIYFCIEKPKTVSGYHNVCGLELIGEGKLCIMAPSKGYKRLNDNTPTTVQNLESVFHEALQRARIQVEAKGWFRQTEKPEEGYKGPDPPCIKALLNGVDEGLRNEVGIRLASYFLNFKGLEKFKALNHLRNWNLRNRPPLSDKEFNSILESAMKHGYIYGCEDEVLKQYCSRAECPFAAKRKVVKTAFAELPDGRLAEEAYDGENVYFLVYDLRTGQVEKIEEIETENCVYQPIKNSDVENFLTLFPSQVEDYDSEERLFQEVVDFMNRWHEAPNERERKLDALYVFLTYVYDLLPRIPYRRALGAYGRGKSAWLQTLGFICYRPIILAGCDTDKAIVRRVNLWKGTALIDEADFNNSTLYSFIIKILEVGYDRQFGFYQRADDVNPQKTLNYYVYGPKLLATRKEFKDMALESRCLTFIAREKTKPMPLYRDKKFMEEAQVLRNKLILWRFRKYHELKEQTGLLEKPDFEREFEGLNISSRIKEIIGPLALINPAFKPVINDLAKELDELLKTDPDAQLEQAFNEALTKIYDELEEEEVEGGRGGEGLLGAPYTTIGKQSLTNYVKNKEDKIVLWIPLVKFAKTILDNPEPDPNELKGLNQKLSRVVKTRLGFKVKKIHGRSCVEIPLTYRPSTPLSPSTTQVKTILLNDSLPKGKVHMKSLNIQPARPSELTTFINKIELAGLQRQVNRIKAKGVWIEKHGYFIGSLNNAYSKRYLFNLAEKLPLLLHKPPKPPREKPIVVPPETPIEEALLMVEKARQKTRQRQPKAIIYRPKWAHVLPPFNLSEVLRASLKIPEDILVCDLLNLRPLDVQFKEMEEPVKVQVRAFTTETVPGCFGRYGRPIRFWQFGCSMCAWAKQCLHQTTADMRKDWRKTVKVRRGSRYAYITVNLNFTPFKLNVKGQKKVQKLIIHCIMQHWNCRSVRKQWFAVNEKYVSFKIFRKDEEEITKEIVEILSEHAEVQP